MKPITTIRHEQMLHYWLCLCLPDSTAAAVLHASAVHVIFFFHLWFHMMCNVYCRVCMFRFDTQCVLQGVYGAGAHTDYGAFTVLATDDNPGLQIYTSGKWQHVKPVPGTFVINLGDMLER